MKTVSKVVLRMQTKCPRPNSTKYVNQDCSRVGKKIAQVQVSDCKNYFANNMLKKYNYKYFTRLK